jgi:hypothetical protein
MSGYDFRKAQDDASPQDAYAHFGYRILTASAHEIIEQMAAGDAHGGRRTGSPSQLMLLSGCGPRGQRQSAGKFPVTLKNFPDVPQNFPVLLMQGIWLYAFEFSV